MALAASALVAAGGVTAALVANANVENTCDASNSAPQHGVICQLNDQYVPAPSAITLVVTLKSGDGQNDQYAGVSWTGSCAENGSTSTYADIAPSPTPAPKTPISPGGSLSYHLVLPYTDSRYCTISVTAALYTTPSPGVWESFTTGSIELKIEYTPVVFASASASPSASPGNVPLIKGYGGKCLDDKGNSSANRTKVIIWACNSADPSQRWKFTRGELVHNGKCANDQGNGGSGAKVIVWTCTGSSDEKWSHTGSDGEFVLASRSHGLLCLTDPGHSTTNRTQLIVYACHNTSNQHWT